MGVKQWPPICLVPLAPSQFPGSSSPPYAPLPPGSSCPHPGSPSHLLNLHTSLTWTQPYETSASHSNLLPVTFLTSVSRWPLFQGLQCHPPRLLSPPGPVRSRPFFVLPKFHSQYQYLTHFLGPLHPHLAVPQPPRLQESNPHPHALLHPYLLWPFLLDSLTAHYPHWPPECPLPLLPCSRSPPGFLSSSHILYCLGPRCPPPKHIRLTLFPFTFPPLFSPLQDTVLCVSYPHRPLTSSLWSVRFDYPLPPHETLHLFFPRCQYASYRSLPSTLCLHVPANVATPLWHWAHVCLLSLYLVSSPALFSSLTQDLCTMLSVCSSFLCPPSHLLCHTPMHCHSPPHPNIPTTHPT